MQRRLPLPRSGLLMSTAARRVASAPAVFALALAALAALALAALAALALAALAALALATLAALARAALARAALVLAAPTVAALVVAAPAVAAAGPAIAAGSLGVPGRTGQPPERHLSGVVSHVADGDTLDVSAAGRAVTVRLDGIDAPEGGQPFSVEARRHLRVVAFGQRVTVVVSDTDRYGRLVGRVLIGADERGRGGKDASEEMVRAGLAWHFTRYSSDPRLAQLEAAARARRAGLWSDPSAIPPWTWRSRERAERSASPRSASPGSDPPRSASPRSTPPRALPSERITAAAGPYRGNASSGVYHAPSCRDYHCRNCTRVFATRQEAESAGFHPHRECVFPRK
jgi:endonuclease YncB( thermonuclease family)